MRETKEYREMELLRLKKTFLVLVNGVISIGIVHYAAWILYNLAQLI